MSARSTSRNRPLVLALRVTVEEAAVIDAAARAEVVSVAEFCRRAAVDRAEHSMVDLTALVSGWSDPVVQEDRP